MNKKLRCVLLVDDDDQVNDLHKVVVETTGCAQHIHVSQDGFDALNYVESKEKYIENGDVFPVPELILLDLNMPGMSGWEFIEEYSKIPVAKRRKIKLVVLTSSMNPDDEAAARKLPEVADYKIKPLTTSAIKELVCG